MNFFDLLFPKRCVTCGKAGSYICKNCFLKIEFIEYPICTVCQRQAIGGRTHPGCRRQYGLDGLVVAAKYRGPVRAAIQKIKYRFVWDIHANLIDLVADSLWRYSPPKKVVLVSVPLYRRRKNWRGFNQADLLARDLSKKFKEKYVADLIFKTLDTRRKWGFQRKRGRKTLGEPLVFQEK